MAPRKVKGNLKRFFEKEPTDLVRGLRNKKNNEVTRIQALRNEVCSSHTKSNKSKKKLGKKLNKQKVMEKTIVKKSTSRNAKFQNTDKIQSDNLYMYLRSKNKCMKEFHNIYAKNVKSSVDQFLKKKKNMHASSSKKKIYSKNLKFEPQQHVIVKKFSSNLFPSIPGTSKPEFHQRTLTSAPIFNSSSLFRLVQPQSGMKTLINAGEEKNLVPYSGRKINEEYEIKKNRVFVVMPDGTVFEESGSDRQKAVLKATTKMQAIRCSPGKIYKIEKAKYMEDDSYDPKKPGSRYGCAISSSTKSNAREDKKVVDSKLNSHDLSPFISESLDNYLKSATLNISFLLKANPNIIPLDKDEKVLSVGKLKWKEKSDNCQIQGHLDPHRVLNIELDKPLNNVGTPFYFPATNSLNNLEASKVKKHWSRKDSHKEKNKKNKESNNQVKASDKSRQVKRESSRSIEEPAKDKAEYEEAPGIVTPSKEPGFSLAQTPLTSSAAKNKKNKESDNRERESSRSIEEPAKDKAEYEEAPGIVTPFKEPGFSLAQTPLTSSAANQNNISIDTKGSNSALKVSLLEEI